MVEREQPAIRFYRFSYGSRKSDSEGRPRIETKCPVPSLGYAIGLQGVLMRTVR